MIDILRQKISCYSLVFVFIFLYSCLIIKQKSFAQKEEVQWASKVIEVSSEYFTDPPSPQYRAIQILGKPNKLPAMGSSPCAWSPANENARANEWIKVGFSSPMQIRQVGIGESFNAGAVSHVYLYDEKNKEYLIYENMDTKARDSLGRMFHIFFPLTAYNVCAVKVVLNITDVKGWNHIDAIGISASPVPIQASINLACESSEKNIEHLGDSINSEFDEIMPVISSDGRTLYIDRKNHKDNIPSKRDNSGKIFPNDDIWYATLTPDGTWSRAKHLPEPLNNDSHNYVCTVTPDGNTLLVANRYIKGGKSIGGISISHRINTLDEWTFPEPVNIDEYYNLNKYAEFFLANNRKSLLLAIQREDSYGERDLYVSFAKPNGSWTSPKNLGSIINTAGIELTPFLAADDRTLYFSSNGFSGFGETDIFMSRRLDDTWQNWTEPVNMGSFLNSKDWDASCTIDAKGEYVYFVSYQNSNNRSADIFRAKLPQEVRPNPVVLISGKVLNTKTNQPVSAEIIYEFLEKGIEAGYALANPTTGEYKIILPASNSYGFWAKAKGFLPMSENIDLSEINSYQELTKDLFLTPIEVGQAVKLNNIFFEQSSATLLAQSYPELERLLRTLKENPSMKIRLEGHTDIEGKPQNNLKLSQDRVDFIKSYLISKGVEPQRISTLALGESQPLTRSRDEESKKRNRRVELRILE
ncbi:OmpA family protein [Thermoflexibacter ruber]|uniref:Outer membrane protein OmpA n=1 Tax=Thermoflexibacter ruber TaxID=1003 RepID=A0A1I2GDU5_9BACT|nr:OmpA family protein [Thermoflexibacter ruber]SFF15672.1 Outer membrane protein OmpA [Thermoflexibacter ruber]